MGLRVSIIGEGRNCSNGGVSSQANNLTIVNIDGPFEPSDDAPGAVLKSHVFRSVVVVPVDVPDGVAGPMAGGNYVVSSDSRWGQKLTEMGQANSYIAVPLHDRFESWEHRRLETAQTPQGTPHRAA